MNTFRLLCIALLPGFVIAGVLVPTGSIIGTAASYFDVAAAEVAVYFTGLTGGLFLGYILSFFVFDHFRIKTVIIISYSIAVLAVISSQTIESLFGLFTHLLVIGTMIGLVSCASSSIISHLWGGNKRQTALVAQDAMFNVGGAMAASATGYFIQQQYAWNMTYFCVSAVVVLVILLTVFSSFRDVGAADNAADEPAGGGAGEPLKTEWNAGIILIGVSVLLFMFTKAVMIIWTPQYMEQILLVDAKRASEFMSNVYLAALVGSILITLLSSRINVAYLIGSLVLLGILITWVITLSDEAGTVLLLGYVFGIALSATLHAY
ncbi:MAG: MFS transporter, partial [Haliea sp.]